MDNLDTELPPDNVVIKMVAFREWISDKLMTAAADFSGSIQPRAVSFSIWMEN